MTLPWAYEDEQSSYANSVMDAAATKSAIVPQIWSPEVANALVVAMRRNRLHQVDIVGLARLPLRRE